MPKDLFFSKRSKDALTHAYAEAVRAESIEVTPEHIFLGIIKTDDPTRNTLLELSINVEELISLCSPRDMVKGKPPKSDLSLSRSAEKIVKIVPLEAKLVKGKYIEPYHFLLAILREQSNAIHLELERQGIADKVREGVHHAIASRRLRSNRLLARWI